MKVLRKDRTLNDAIEYLDDVYNRANQDVRTAIGMLDDAELQFIYDETKKCLSRRYYLENYHCIRDEHGNWKTLSPFWDHQEIVYEVVEEEFADHGFCRIIVLKPRQTGISTWVSAAMFHKTIYTPHAFTMLVAQNGRTSEHVYNMSINAYHALPWWSKPEFLYKTKGDQIEFQRADDAERATNPGLGSILQCSNAQEMSGVAIGRSLSNLHACLTANNLVLLPSGRVDSIANAFVGSRVMTESGPATVTAYSTRHAENIYAGASDGYSITPWLNSAFPIEGTGNHKILCVKMTPYHVANKTPRQRGERAKKVISEPEMIELSSITKKHSVVVPVRKIQEGGTIPGPVSCGERKQGGGVQSFYTPPRSAKDIGFAVGLYLAEGSCNHRITITLDRDEKDMADRFAAAIGVAYGKVVSRPDSRTTQYHYYGSALAKWFETNVGKKDDKRIPEWLWSLGREAIAACVEGMILGDGHIEPKVQRTCFTSTRAQLAIGIRDAVASLGHGYGSIITREAGFHYGRNCQKVYTVAWCQNVDRSIRKEYGWAQAPNEVTKDYSHWQYSKDQQYVYLSVRKIERVKVDVVYDIEVDTPEHTFLLPGAITHNSEVSRWPSSDLYEGDIKPSLNAKDMFEVMESTGLGRNGLFYEQWQGAMAGDTELRPVFIPVYKVRKYYLPIKGQWTPTADELAFDAKVLKEESFAIPNEFWNFRRRGIRAAKTSPGGKAGFLESYPITPTEAFQASGICAFDRECLEEQEMRYACKPIYAGEISLGFDDKTPNTDMIRQVADDEILPKRKGDRPSKRLHIWEFPEPGETYYVSGDASLGVEGGDFANCPVFRSGKGSAADVQVAEWWGRCPPQEFARIMAALGYWYNGAELAVEYAKEGITVGDKLVDMDYPAIYRERMRDRPGGAYKHYFHFTPNEKTRSSIIACMNEALLTHNRAGEPTVIIRSIELIDEMIDFGSIGGKMEGQGNHDDGCIANMICLYCMRETTSHLKGSANDSARGERVGDINVYGVYDHLNRQRGQYQDKAMALEVVKGQAGWQVIPILICKANTLWSPTYDDPNSAEFKLRHQHGMSSDEIVPSLVSSFKAAYDQVAVGGGGNNDVDW